MHKIIIEEKVIDDIPLNEYHDENQKIKRLVFVQHGFTSNKDTGTDSLSLRLARAGFLVVSIDAYKHGRRIQEPFISKPLHEQYFDIYTVVKRTARDIERLYQKHYQSRFEKYDIVGISMGGMIAHYLTTISNHLSHVVPIISSPDFYQVSLDSFSGELAEYKHFVLDKKRYIDRISPINHIDKMNYEYMLMLNGVNDQVINYQMSEEFYQTQNAPNIYFKLYDEVHHVNYSMQEDVTKFLLDEDFVTASYTK